MDIGDYQNPIKNLRIMYRLQLFHLILNTETQIYLTDFNVNKKYKTGNPVIKEASKHLNNKLLLNFN